MLQLILPEVHLALHAPFVCPEPKHEKETQIELPDSLMALTYFHFF